MSNANLGVRIVLEDGAKAGFDALSLSAMGLGSHLYGLGAIWNKMSDTMKGVTIGTGLLGLAFGGLMDAEKTAIDAAAEFNTAMNEIDLSVNGASDNVQQMQSTLVNLADAGVFSTTQLAHGFAQLGIDGWTAKDIMDHLGSAAMYMAEAMRSETTPAFNLLGTAMEMYHANAAQATEFTKDLTFAFYNGQKSVTNLQQAMNMVGPVAYQLHVPFGELTDVLALLGQAGLKGSQGASSLQYYLTNLTSPTDKAAKELKALGVSVYDSNGNFIGLVASIEKLGPALSKLSEKDRNQAIANLFNIRSGRDAREFFANFVDTINKIGSLDKLRQGTDVMQKAVSVTDTFSGGMQRLGTTIRDAFKFIGEAQLGPLGGLVNGIQGLVHQFNIAGDAVHNNAALFLVITTVLVGLGFIVGTLAVVFTVLSTAISGPVLAAIAGVVGGVIGAVALFFELKAAVESNKWAMDALKAILGALGTVWKLLQDQIHQLLPTLKLMEPVWNVLKFLLAGVAVIIGGVLLGAVMGIILVFAGLALAIRYVIQFLAAAGTAIGHFFSMVGTLAHAAPAAFTAAWNLIRTTALSVWNSLVAGITGFITHIRTSIQSGFNTVVGIIRGAINTVVGWFSWLYNHNYYFQALVDKIRQVFNTARAFITAVWSAISSWLSGAWHKIVDTASQLWNLLTGTIHQKILLAQYTIQGVIAAIKGMLSGAWNNIVATAQGAWGRFTGAINAAIAPAKGAATSVVNGIKGVIDGIKIWMANAGSTAVHMFADAFGRAAGAVIQKAKDLAGNIAKILGFHSPPPEGPLADSDQYMPNMMKMYAHGIEQHLPLVHAASGKVASALTGAGSAGMRFAGSSSGGGASGGVQHIHLYIDGHEVSQVVMDQLTGQFQNNGAGRWHR